MAMYITVIPTNLAVKIYRYLDIGNFISELDDN